MGGKAAGFVRMGCFTGYRRVFMECSCHSVAVMLLLCCCIVAVADAETIEGIAGFV